MSRFSSLLAPIRKSLLERDDNPFESLDPFRPLDEVRKKRPPVALPLAAPVGPPGLPETRNRPGDLGRVERALGDAGFLGDGARRRPVFDTRLETGVRDFQRRKGLKVDGLLNPGGPTIRALGRALARPPLRGLSGAAVSANARLVRHLMTTTADGMVPDLMAGDFSTNEAGRAKTADFLSQLFGRDPVRARNLRAKARARMAADEKGLLDRLILQARLFEEDDDPTPDDPGQDDPEEPPEEPDEPPYDPDHPQPGDPDDPEPEEPEEPDEPDEPKPDCEAEEEAVESAQEEFENAETHLESAQGALAETELDIDRTEGKIAKTENFIQDKKDHIASIEREIEKAEFIERYSPQPVHRAMERQKISEFKDEIERLKGKIEQAQEELKALRAELKTLKETLAQRQKDVAEAKESLEQARAALREAEEALTDCENRDG